MIKTILLVTILAIQWKPPTPQQFTVDTDEADISVIEEVREPKGGAKGKSFVRAMMIRYKVATSDRREDQMTALFLGAPNDDAGRIDTALYEGWSWVKMPELEYLSVKFYAGDDLIATKEIKRIDDPYNAKAKRIYERARLLYEREKKLGK